VTWLEVVIINFRRHRSATYTTTIINHLRPVWFIAIEVTIFIPLFTVFFFLLLVLSLVPPLRIDGSGLENLLPGGILFALKRDDV
jgi:hypothetical protein